MGGAACHWGITASALRVLPLRPSACLTHTRLPDTPPPLPQCLARTEELVRKANDIIDNRLDANLTAVARTCLVDLPSDRTFTYDEFVSAQSRYIRKLTEGLVIRNQEVQRSCEELLDLLASWPRENTDVKLDAAECTKFRDACSRQMYQVRGWGAGRLGVLGWAGAMGGWVQTWCDLLAGRSA